MDAKNRAQNYILWLWSAYCRGPRFWRVGTRISAGLGLEF